MSFQGVTLRRLFEISERLPDILGIIRPLHYKERTVVFPEGRLIIAPVPLGRVLEARGLPVLDGLHGADWEHLSFIPPGGVTIPAADGIPSSPLPDLDVLLSSRTGRNIKVAMLDTGLDFNHPDFRNSRFVPVPLTPQGSAQDMNGHGTHTIGLACGPRVANDGNRYGVATEATVLVIRVFDHTRAGVDDETLIRSIYLARDNHADIIVMSLGGTVAPGDGYSQPFEDCVQQLTRNILMIAAAGDDPPVDRWPTNHPANCPSIMAIAGLDENLFPWDQSSVSQGLPGDEIDLSARGENIRSSKLNGGYENRSGTSAANALAGGIAALWAEATGLRGDDLRAVFSANYKPVTGGTPEEVGAGMTRAPR